MTQNTQTTTERITALIFDAIRMDSTTFETVDAECATIAAEIDGLRDEMAVILRERNDAHLALAEARAEVERLRPAAEAWRQVEVAREILSLVEINARVGMHYNPRHSDELERRSTAQIEDAIARACVRWPNATRNEIVVAVNVTDKRVRESQAWKRHCESRASVENP